MSSHVHPPGTPKPADRGAFLIDGCERCAEYLEDLGLHFDADRYRAFWKKMVEVEYDTVGGYESKLDKQLGRRLYYVSLSLQRAFGLDPRDLAAIEAGMLVGIVSLETDRCSDERERVSLDDALEMLEIIDDYDAGDGPEHCVHTFRGVPGMMIGAHWPLEKMKAAIVEHGVELSGAIATGMGHGLVMHDDRGALFIATRKAEL